MVAEFELQQGPAVVKCGRYILILLTRSSCAIPLFLFLLSISLRPNLGGYTLLKYHSFCLKLSEMHCIWAIVLPFLASVTTVNAQAAWSVFRRNLDVKKN